MNTRKRAISIALGSLILFFSITIYWAKNLRIVVTEEEFQAEKQSENISKVSVLKVKETSLNKKLEFTGVVVPSKVVEIYSEVPGNVQFANRSFKAGVSFKKGELLLSINNEEILSTLISQRSNFLSNSTKLLSDLKLDFPEIYDSWRVYITDFDINKSLNPLPKTLNDQQKLFLTGRGIYASFFSIKQLEAKLLKYQIRAPFSGTITESFINQGSVIRVGQKLGEYIGNQTYELEANIPLSAALSLKVGDSYDFSSPDEDRVYTGKVLRINQKVDGNTQSIRVYFSILSNDLRAGMFLSANGKGEELNHVFIIPKTALVENESVFIVKNKRAVLQNITVESNQEDQVVVRGLSDNQLVITDKKSIRFANSRVSTKISTKVSTK